MRACQVILALINNWESTGSVDETVGWANLTVSAYANSCTAASCDRFSGSWTLWNAVSPATTETWHSLLTD